MIGEADTKAPRPPHISVPGYAKGALLRLGISCKATGLGVISDDFTTLDDWIPVYGKLLITSGNVHGPTFGYAAGRHKTQLLSDNCRAKVTIQSGTILLGESRVFICADEQMSGYYGLSINRTLLATTVSIIRGRSSIGVDLFEATTASVSPGDEFEAWYDRANSTVRVYQNGSEICSKYFPPTDIPHGPGRRWTGVVMGCRKFLDGGPRFTAFEATDVAYPAPVLHDPVDALTPNASWVEVLNEIKVNRHAFAPNTLGPKNALYTSSAARWTSEMGTNSCRVVFTAHRLFSGKFRLAVRSSADMTNWVGVEFDGLLNKIRVVQGTGPNTVTAKSSDDAWVLTHQQWTVTWEESTKTLRLYKGAERTPRLTYVFSSGFTPSGKYVGLSWTTNLASPGVELSAIDGYDVTADSPLPA